MEAFPLKIYTAGTFDLLHIGHIRFIKRCMQIGELTLGLNTDKVTLDFKEKLPVMKWEERHDIMKEVFPDLKVIQRNDLSYLNDWGDYLPDLIAIGMDWHKKDFLGNMKLNYDFFEEHGIGIVYLPYGNTANTTAIKERVKHA